MIKPQVYYAKYVSFFGFCALAVLIFSCGILEREENNVVITVGSKNISVDGLKRDMEFFSCEMDISEKQQGNISNELLERLIDYYLILEYGKEHGISITENELKSALDDVKRHYTEDIFKESLLREYVDFDQWKDRFKEKLLINKIIKEITENITPPNHKEIERYFEEKHDEFRCPKMVRFRQIVTRTKQEAEDILRRINGGEDMGELAGQYSIAPEAESFGEVGWVAQDHMDEAIGKVLFSIPTGSISPVVKTPYGYHIFEVLSTQPESVKKLPEVIHQIESTLLDQERELFLSKWIDELRTHFDVKIDQELLSKLELD